MSKFNNYPNVFTPITVGRMVLKNRIQFSPMVSGHAHTITGEVTNGLIEWVGAQARTGVSLVTIGATPIDNDRARDYYGALSATSDFDMPGLRLLADEAHRYGARLSVELTHAGRLANSKALDGKPGFVPSVIPEYDSHRYLTEITPAEMKGVIANYLAAIGRCMAAGFDMVMIHAAHGNLLSSFLSPVFNRRTDVYGGSLEKRMRFPLEVLEAVRNFTRGRIGVELRICGTELIEGSPTTDDTAAFINAAEEFLDLVNISGGLIIDRKLGRFTNPSYYQPHLLNVEYAAAIKRQISIPLSVVGNITTIDEAESIIASGQVDMVAMAKNLIADQEFVTKAYRGKAGQIRPCIRCMTCVDGPGMGYPLRCAVNPQAGREEKYAFIGRAAERKKIMIIGGGPAGMMAAQIAIKRGHDVVLHEKRDRLGGRLYEAGSMALKDGYRRYIRWDIDATLACGAEIVLNSRVTPETIEKSNPDVVLVAIGAQHALPPIEGIDLPHVITVSDADLRKVPIGRKVVVCGGGLSGTECALDLAQEGREVVLVDLKKQTELCNDAFEYLRIAIFARLAEFAIPTYYECAVSRITPDHVEIVDSEGTVRSLAADSVISAFGLKQDQERIRELVSVIPETYVIGDANQIGCVAKANKDAFNRAVEL